MRYTDLQCIIHVYMNFKNSGWRHPLRLFRIGLERLDTDFNGLQLIKYAHVRYFR